ncbi:MAG TPA: peptidyl-prolyl cis-trans isomerase [Methyloceanibacter sp.]
MKRKVNRVALDTLRKGAGRMFGMILMGLLVFSFAIWGIADIFRGYGRQSLIRVGDIEIHLQDYSRAEHEAMRAMSGDAGRNLSKQEAMKMGLENRVLERLIGGAAVDNHAQDLGLGMSQDAVLEQIKKDPTFQDPTGNFSPLALASILQSLNMSEQGYISEQRERDLRRQLIGTVGDTAPAPQILLDALVRYNDEQRTLRYVLVPLSAAGTAKEPTEEELKAFYDNHHAKFTLPEYRKIGVMAVTPETVKDQVTITDDDLKAAFEKEKDKLGKPEKRHVQQITFPDQAAAEAAAQRIQSGTDFAAIAKEQGLSDADFDLGTLTRNEMADATIADEAFKLDKDKVSAPVTGKLGKVVLLRVTEIEPGEVVTFEQAKPNLEKGVLKDRAERLILDLRDKIEDERASGSKLSEVADKLKLTYQTVEAVDRKGQAPDGSAITLPAETELLEAAFVTDTGVENDPIEPKDLGIIWYEVLGETPEQLKPFDQVKDEVTKAWGEDEARNRLAKYSQELVTSLNGGKTLDDLAKELNTEILTTEPLKRADLSVNIMPATMTQAYLLPKGGFGTAASGSDDKRVVFQVDTILPPKELEAPAASAIKRQLDVLVSDDIIGEYFSALEKRYGVSVNEAALNKLAGGEEQQ